MLSHLLDTLTEIMRQFTLGNTTTATVFILLRENLEIVQLAKDAELTKLGVTPSRSSYHALQAVPRGSRDGESVNMRRATVAHEAGNKCPN